jgi:hypothetical protein
MIPDTNGAGKGDRTRQRDRRAARVLRHQGAEQMTDRDRANRLMTQIMRITEIPFGGPCYHRMLASMISAIRMARIAGQQRATPCQTIPTIPQETNQMTDRERAERVVHECSLCCDHEEHLIQRIVALMRWVRSQEHQDRAELSDQLSAVANTLRKARVVNVDGQVVDRGGPEDDHTWPERPFHTPEDLR